MGEHKAPEILRKEISDAQVQIPVGSLWGHFKNPDHHYEITGFVIIEETDEVGVLYKSTFEPTNGITFLRPVASFLSEKELEDGTKVKRFTKVS